MKRALKILSITAGLILLLVLLAVAVVPREKLLSYLAPSVSQISVTHATITETSATMKVQLEVSSRLIPVFIDSMSYELRLYRQSIARGQQAFTPDTRRRRSQQLLIPIKVAHNQARELVRRQIAENEKMRIKASVWYHLPLIGRRRMDIDQKADLVIPVLPGARIVGLRIDDFSFDHMAMTMTMAIDNPNKFDFYLRQMDYTIQLQDYMIAEGKLHQPYLIKARDVTLIQLPAVSDLKRPLKASYKALSGDSDWPYHMKSEMILEPRSGVVGQVYMNTDKYGIIDVREKLRELKKIEKQKRRPPKPKRPASKPFSRV